MTFFAKFEPHNECRRQSSKPANPANSANPNKEFRLFHKFSDALTQSRTDKLAGLAELATLDLGFGSLSSCIPNGWTQDDWFAFEERAAILEFCEGLSREEAERLAGLELGFGEK